MAGDVANIKVCSPLKLRIGLTGNYHATCHYSYNLPLPPSVKKTDNKTKIESNPLWKDRKKRNIDKKSDT